MSKAYISIGSNIKAKKNIAIAKKELNQLFSCTYSDNFYSEAEGFKGQDFINLVAGFETSFHPVRLTKKLKALDNNFSANSITGMDLKLVDEIYDNNRVKSGLLISSEQQPKYEIKNG